MVPQTRIKVFFQKAYRAHTEKEFRELTSPFKEKRISVRCYRTKDIYDRVWIPDRSDPFVVGTSFNGLGSKFAFLLQLPGPDREAFLRELDEIRNPGDPFVLLLMKTPRYEIFIAQEQCLFVC